MIFDLGGVLVESRGLDVLGETFPDLGGEEIRQRWLRSPSVMAFESGRLAPAEFAGAFVREWGLRAGADEFLEAFSGWVTGFCAGAADLVRSLRARHRVACLSNTNAIHWARMPEAVALFDACFVSFRTGWLKPDGRAFLHALRELGTAAEDAWFFDDSPENVAAARALGLRAFRVEGVAELRALLRSEGLCAGQAG